MPSPDLSKAPLADKAALVRIGEQVRTRLLADPMVERVAVDDAEIYTVAEFLSPAECQRFMDMVDAVAKPSQTFDTEYGASYRTSYSGDTDPYDPFVRMIQRRIDDLLGIDPSYGETIQGQRYTPGQLFEPHTDWFYTLADYWPAEAQRGGQRSWTTMIYLNTVEAGGVTEFNRIGVSITPQAGALLAWNNADAEGRPNLQTTHAARPVEAGVKYVITKWYRTRKWA